MRKQSNGNNSTNFRSRKSENLGKGKVTPVQVAFIVDRYLSDNNLTQTRSTFRSEASNLMSKSSVQEAPKSLLSLGAMLDEYICLKEQKVSLEQERCRMEEEKFRVHTLLKGMQDAMNAFNATAHELTPTPPPPPPPPPPAMNAFNDLKRKGFKGVPDSSLTAKRSCRNSTTKHLPPKDSQPSLGDNHQAFSQKQTAAQSLARPHVSGGTKVDGSNAVQSSHVVKRLFNQPVQSPSTNSSGPKTPPLESFSQAGKSASPLENCSTAGSSKDATPQQITSTNCTIVSTETIRVSPAKQISYYSVARNQHISTSSPVKTNLKKPNKRDHVKGRLDFDAPNMHIASEKPVSNEISTSDCVKEVDILDLDLPCLDALGDINLSELLVDFDLADEGTSYCTQPAVDSSPDSITWSPQKSGEANIGANQVFAQLSSIITEILAEKDPSGPDSVTTVTSVTKTIKILSPAKSQRSSLDTESLPDKNRQE